MRDPRSFALRPGVVHRRVDDEVILLEPASSEYFSINGTGAVLWRLLVGGADETDLRRELSEQFGIDAPSAELHVSAFIDALVEMRLIEVTGRSDP